MTVLIFYGISRIIFSMHRSLLHILNTNRIYHTLHKTFMVCHIKNKIHDLMFPFHGHILNHIHLRIEFPCRSFDNNKMLICWRVSQCLSVGWLWLWVQCGMTRFAMCSNATRKWNYRRWNVAVQREHIFNIPIVLNVTFTGSNISYHYAFTKIWHLNRFNFI